MSHPNFPTLKCIQDVFASWSVKCLAVRVSLDELKRIKGPFIAHKIQGEEEIVLVTKIEKEKVYFFSGRNKREVEDYKVFSQFLTGIVLILEDNNHHREKDFEKKKGNEIIEILIVAGLPLIYFTIILSATVTFFILLTKSFNPMDFFLGLSIVGSVITVGMVMQEQKIRSKIIDKICHRTRFTDCNAVLDSKASNFFGWINFTDVGFVYFLGLIIYQFVSKFISVNQEAISAIVVPASLSIGFAVFSIYYQFFKIKKLCPLCMIVQIVLVCQFVLLVSYIEVDISTLQYLPWLILTMILVVFPYGLLRLLVETLKRHESTDNRYRKLKANIKVFNTLLSSNVRIDSEKIPPGLVFGNPTSNVKITAYLSIGCFPCGQTFNQLIDLYRSHKNAYHFNILISGTGSRIDRRLFELMDLNSDNIEAALNELSLIYNKNSYNGQPLLGETTPKVCLNSKSFDLHRKAFFDNSINATPMVFINGYLLGPFHNLSDLKFFGDDIKQLCERIHYC
jgi:uncharacterized membrane protein